MERNYVTGTLDNIVYFTGVEIEKTPAHGMKTLFVVGIQNEQIIMNLAHDNECRHIYFGANQSFSTSGINDIATWDSWERMIETCLEAGFWCTLDLDIKDAEGLLESGLVEQRRFIPQISVKLPYLNQLGYNATIKIDDKDFAATNPGVWCIPLSTLTHRRYFTDWDQYSKDEVLG
jgi:hypothetical protein